MPKPNAIVSTTVRLDVPGDRPPADVLREEGGLSVELDGGRQVRLDPANERSAGFAQVLDGLSKQRLPVYLEFDAATDAVTLILIPYVARVIGVNPGEGDTLDVELDASHARHVLRLGDADAGALERELRDALNTGALVILVEGDDHVIIDVQAFKPAPDGPLPPFPLPPTPLPKPALPPWPLSWIWWLLHWLWWWICWPWWWFRCLSTTKAQQVFNAMAATSCDPLTVPAPCIPFMYPDDGCWARAHEMCRLMINMGLPPRKVWIDHSTGYWLHVNTKNNPQCYVEWGWHVAPTLCVRVGWFRTQRMVIDPSLFTTPVSQATWKGVQGDPAATLTDTDASVFWHGGGTDPTYSASNSILATYRLKLQTRSIQVGPPPYAHCP